MKRTITLAIYSFMLSAAIVVASINFLSPLIASGPACGDITNATAVTSELVKPCVISKGFPFGIDPGFIDSPTFWQQINLYLDVLIWFIVSFIGLELADRLRRRRPRNKTAE
jgi:hypothetical protein